MYLVESYFCSDYVSLRNQIYARYSSFVKKLRESPSFEIKVLSALFIDDARSKTCQNIRFLSELTEVDIVQSDKATVKSLLPRATIPPLDTWRTRLLDLFMEARTNVGYRNSFNVSETYVKEMISSLCSS